MMLGACNAIGLHPHSFDLRGSAFSFGFRPLKGDAVIGDTHIFDFPRTICDEVPEPLADLEVTQITSNFQDADAEMIKVNYVITVANNGPNDSTGAALKVAVPEPLSLPFAVVNEDLCSSIDEHLVICDLGDLPAGQTVDVTVVTRLPNGLHLSITNKATVIPGAPSDPVPENNEKEHTIGADLEVTKTISAGPAGKANTLTYSITAKNNGPNETLFHELVDEIESVALVSFSDSSDKVECELQRLFQTFVALPRRWPAVNPTF